MEQSNITDSEAQGRLLSPSAVLESTPMYWTAEAIMDAAKSRSVPEYVVEANVQEREELIAAIKQSKALDGDSINPDTFPLPTLGARLEQVSHVLFEGRGFAIIRSGIDPGGYTDIENVNALLGVASHIGDEIGVQDKRGNALTHITAARHWSSPNEVRHAIHTNTGLAFHTDMGADILALHVRAQAESGGYSYLVSIWPLYMELLMSHPRVLDLLSQHAWPIQITANPPSHILAPLLQVYEGKIWISVDPGRLGLHPVTAAAVAQNRTETSIPDLTPEQLEALDILSKLACKHRLRLNTKPGDIIFISNWSHLHARDSYQDPFEGPRRHLVRLWLRNSKLSWEVPESLRVPWEAAYGNDLIFKRYPASPARKYKPSRYTAGSAAFVLADIEDVNCEAADTTSTLH